MEPSKIPSTVPINQPEMAVVEVFPVVKASIYDWSTGNSFMLSKRQKVIVDALMEKEDFKYIRGRVKEECGSEITNGDVRKELERENVVEYLTKRMEDRGIAQGLSLDAYVALGYRVLRGELEWKPEQVMVWKQIAKVRGFEAGSGTHIINSIEIVQKNGEK